MPCRSQPRTRDGAGCPWRPLSSPTARKAVQRPGPIASEDEVRLDGGAPLVHVQARAADVGRGDADGILDRRLYLRVRHLLHGNFKRFLIDDRFYGYSFRIRRLCHPTNLHGGLRDQKHPWRVSRWEATRVRSRPNNPRRRPSECSDTCEHASQGNGPAPRLGPPFPPVPCATGPRSREGVTSSQTRFHRKRRSRTDRSSGAGAEAPGAREAWPDREKRIHPARRSGSPPGGYMGG